MIEQWPGAAIAVDGEGRIAVWNSAAEHRLGRCADDAVGRQWTDILIPVAPLQLPTRDSMDCEDEQPPVSVRAIAIEAGGGRTEVVLKAAALDAVSDAWPLTVLVVEPVEAVHDADPRPFDEDLGRESGPADFHDRRRWESERARSAAIVNSTSDAIIVRDLDGVITDWNPGAEAVYGYTAGEAIGQRGSLIVPQPLDDEVPALAEALRLGQRLEHFESVRRHKDGELIDVSITVSPLLDMDGQLIGAATIERDISRVKQREAELRRAKHLAETAQQTQRQFLANVSHELRTPMNAIIGMIDLSLGEALPELVRDYLETARDSSRVMLSLVDDLLDYSRMEAGRFELESDPFSIRRVLDSAMRSLSLRAFEVGLELLCDVAPDVPDRLVGDSRRFRQVVTNLAGNALKFTEAGEVSVRLGVVRQEASHVVLRLDVRDTGMGISEADQERIFQAFTQVDASSTRRYSGAGLGLTICREIVERMEGGLELQSVSGQGSTFSAIMRFAVLTRRRLEAELPVEQLESLPVLVVDDNATNRRILATTLSNWSMRPVVVDGPDAALAALSLAERSGDSYPLLIVDGAMPKMDGCDLVEQLEQQGLIGEARVLMLSSGGRQSVSERIRRLPIAAFLQKPVSQSMLLDAIMTVLNGPPQRSRDVAGIRPTSRPLDVLVAEDTPANRKVVEAILTRRGHHPHLVANGRQAVESCRNNRYDAVLMDVQMPVMDGLQATAVIRTLPGGDRIPIIAMTAHAMRGDRESCLRAGMDAYISKPIVADELLQLLEQSAARMRAADGSADRTGRQDADMSHAASIPPAAGQGREPILNLAVARQRLGGDERLLRDMAQFFLEDAPPLLGDVRTALDEGRLEAATRAAHSLKGLAANFDAHACVNLAQQLEDDLREGRTGTVGTQLEAVAGEVDRVIDALRSESLL
ncbi:MAG: response regulator [Planctomyces sp.]|nr:response regulator [Planctomyces sp.]